MSIYLTHRKIVRCTKCKVEYSVNLQKDQRYTNCYECGELAEVKDE